MRILIVEDSIVLVNIYSDIIKNTSKQCGVGDVDIISVINHEEYCYFNDMEFDLAIFDWNINGETSQKIVEESIDKVNNSVFITGYAKNKDVCVLSEKYNIPIISKPTAEVEITEVITNALTVDEIITMV